MRSRSQRNRYVRKLSAIAGVCVWAIFCCLVHAEINVAAAVSLKEVMAKLADQFHHDTGESVEFTFGSSGQLVSQIQNGAPIDLFISAGQKQVDDLIASKSADASTRRVIAGNALVLISPADPEPVESIGSLSKPSVKKIAMGEPKTVPAGQYAMQSLQRAGLFDGLKQKLVFATNVRQVLNYVERGEVSAGIVYATDAKQSGAKIKLGCTIDPATHDSIVYPAVLMTGAKNAGGAARFLAFVLSENGQAVLKSFGFAPAPELSPMKLSPTTAPATVPAK